MIIFINGSINSGKSTTGRLLAGELGYEFVEFDDIRHTIPEPNIDKALPLVFEKGIKLLNELDKNGKSAIVAYPLSQKNYNLIKNKLSNLPRVITLSPRLDIVLEDRGDRNLDNAERERIKYHYQIGINNPKFGDIIDNSDLSVKETVDIMMGIISSNL
jgi:adenylate kinase family enzyme